MFVLLEQPASSGIGVPGSLFKEQTLERALFSKNLLILFLSEVNFFFLPPELLKGLI